LYRFLLQRFSAAVGLSTALIVWAALQPSPVAAQPNDSPIRLRGSIVAGGIGAFAEDRWALVRANVVNESETDRELRLVYSFDIESDRQFVRRTWVPAGARRIVDWPARLASVGAEDKSADGRAMLLAADSETSYSDQPGTVIVLKEDHLTAIINSGDPEADLAIDGVISVREVVGLSRRLIYPSQIARHGPRYTLGWEPAAVVVLASNEIDLDASRRRAIRRWIRAGGTLWVMADQVDSDKVATMLGDDWGVTEVDRVTLNEVAFDYADGPRRSRSGEDIVDEPVIREQPIEMVRLLAPDYRVHMTTRGWPALLERSIGGGRIVVTTVAPRGWDTDQSERAIEQISGIVYAAAATPAAGSRHDEAATEFIDAQIGYEVAGRPTIAIVLGGYVAAVLLVGLLLLTRGRGEWIGPYGIGAAMVATLVLGGIGIASRGKVEPTNATFQAVHVDPGSSVATVTGAIGMFAPFERTASLASQRGGWAWPSDRGSGGTTRRLMWTDLDYWTWEQLPLSGGKAERMDFATTAEFPEQVAVELYFDDQGLAGRIDTGGGGALSDMVLIAPRAAMGVDINSSGDVRISPADMLPANTYVSADVLTVTQQRRSDVLAAYVADRRPDAPPVILGWSDLVDDGLRGDEDMPARGSALWHIPLLITPAQPGQSVTVPWPLTTMSPVRGLKGVRQGGLIYSEQSGEWLPTSLPGAFSARFDLPKAVTPLDPQAVNLLLNIRAVNRPVRILLNDGDRAIELATLEGPDGPQRIDLPADRFADDVQAVTLTVEVGNLTDPTQGIESQSAMWRIRQIGLEVRGTVGDAAR